MAEEETPLLHSESIEDTERSSAKSTPQNQTSKLLRSPASVLPISLLSALAVAATAATQLYTFAYLLCRDAQYCSPEERRRFAGAVAIAGTLANASALVTIRGFEALVKRHMKVGLAVWLIVRSMSVAALSLSVATSNVWIALFSYVFEGLASDNILHFNLNAIFIQAEDQRAVSRLIGSSLALYMLGISISPFLASLLENFRDSFIMASILFLAALLYLFLVFRPPSQRMARARSHTDLRGRYGSEENQDRGRRCSAIRSIGAPVMFLFLDYWRLALGFGLFMYNSVQSVASLYLFFVLWIVPYASKLLRKDQTSQTDGSVSSNGGKTKDGLLALLSLSVNGSALILFSFVSMSWQVYGVSAILALGLAAPSFIKSYFVANFDTTEQPRALAALAVMETGGSLVGPVIFGGIQAGFAGSGVFIGAGCAIWLAGGLVACGMMAKYRQEVRGT